MTARRKLTDADDEFGYGSFGRMQPGDTRVLTDRRGNSMVTLHRTERPYAYDLCDAYNAAMTRDDVEWVVGDGGAPYLRDRADFTERNTQRIKREAERERSIWKANMRRAELAQCHA